MLFRQSITGLRRWAVLFLLFPLAFGLAQTKRTVLPVVLLDLRLHGFEPSDITVKAGPTLLAIHNNSGRIGLIYHITSNGNSPVSPQGMPEMDVRARNTNLHEAIFLDLTPGIYTITEAQEPKWKCTLTVQ
jgi:hypothetical protein